MLTFAVAALAMASPARVQAPTNAICPLYDLTTSVDGSGNVTANFYLCTTWNSSVNNTNNFSYYFSYNNTSMTNFGPNGSWNPISPESYAPISGNQVSVTFSSTNFNTTTPQGVLWVDYNAGANETIDNKAEHSIVATNVGTTHQGANGRPGTIVPIIITTPSANAPRDSGSARQNNRTMTFYINQGFSGWPNGNPSMWCNTGNNNTPYPGNGWQTMNYDNLVTSNGYTNVTATGHPNSNAGYFMVGYLQTYTPNGGTGLWPEFSAFARTVAQ